MTGTPNRQRRDPRRFAAAPGLVVLVGSFVVLALGGCAPSATATPTPAASETVASEDPGPLHAYPDLEARLPRVIAGIALDTFSVPGSAAGPIESAGAPATNDAIGTDDPIGTYLPPDLFATAVRSLGRVPTDLELAFARPIDRNADVVVTAYRLPGFSGAELLAKLGPDDVDGSIEPATIAGKRVLALLQIEATSYAYAADKVVYIVGGSPELIKSAIEALP